MKTFYNLLDPKYPQSRTNDYDKIESQTCAKSVTCNQIQGHIDSNIDKFLISMGENNHL